MDAPLARATPVYDAPIARMVVRLPRGRLGVCIVEVGVALVLKTSARLPCAIPHLCDEWELTRVCGVSVARLRAPRAVAAAAILRRHEDDVRVIELASALVGCMDM